MNELPMSSVKKTSMWMNVYKNIEIKQEWRVEKQMCRWGKLWPQYWVCTLRKDVTEHSDGTVLISIVVEETL